MTLLRHLWNVLKLIFWLFVIATPVLGVWVASSLATYLDGPIWLAIAVGALLFPIAPVLWDLNATKRFEARQEKRKAAGKEVREAKLLFADRLVLRTVAINLGFIIAILAVFPQQGFAALAARGDWFLDDAATETQSRWRPLIFGSAEALAWLYEASLDNPYEEYADEEPTPAPKPTEAGHSKIRIDPPKPSPPAPKPPSVEPPQPVEPKPPVAIDEPDKPIEIEVVNPEEPTKPEPPAEPPRQAGTAPAWPLPAELHPLVRDIPSNVERTHETVARHLAARESDPFQLVKALNDYITRRVSYDFAALDSGEYRKMDHSAGAVFKRKTTVCAGYSRLFAAMGKVAGIEIVYVSGVARTAEASVSGAGHAWNAVKIEGKWYLVDVTWNDGETPDKEPSYSTDYLFTPPEIFSSNHLPKDEAWQLRADPITRGEFIRQPDLRPLFHTLGLQLVSPQRSHVDADRGRLNVAIRNPKRVKVLAAVKNPPGKWGSPMPCAKEDGESFELRCQIPKGQQVFEIFAGDPSQTTFEMVARFHVTAR